VIRLPLDNRRDQEGSRMPRIETALTRLLAIEHPILLTPMGSAAGGKLAAAVTNAGGLGMIGSGQASAATIRQELGEAGNIRVGIGFITWALERNPAALDAAWVGGRDTCLRGVAWGGHR
jgi:nitronate monooxygenase